MKNMHGELPFAFLPGAEAGCGRDGAFFHCYDQRKSLLETIAYIGPDFDLAMLGEYLEEEKEKGFLGIWDTGAEMTTISPAVIGRLELEPAKRAPILINGRVPAYPYDISLLLPNGWGRTRLGVYGFSNPGGHDFVIGMDIITEGELAVSTYAEKTSISFSSHAKGWIDFRSHDLRYHIRRPASKR